jgi:acyl-coenzyme A thioesterase PaaI-like protein
LRDALRLYGVEGGLLAAASGDLRDAVKLRDEFADQDPGALPTVLFEHVAGPLRSILDGHADNDHVITTRIAEVRAIREQALEALRKEVAKAAERLEVVQDMIESQVEGIFKRINDEFDRLDLRRGGYGAQVHFNNVRPNGPGPWRWDVTPRWRRSPSGDLVPYREAANGAQVKVFAVQLVLAALLADVDTHGRVLILDELGNSLGDINRKDVLSALRAVAERRQVTILGTCQDSVLADAADVCGELLWFTHASATDSYNRPTRVWGYDSLAQRVELTADWVRAGREHA